MLELWAIFKLTLHSHAARLRVRENFVYINQLIELPFSFCGRIENEARRRGVGARLSTPQMTHSRVSVWTLLDISLAIH